MNNPQNEGDRLPQVEQKPGYRQGQNTPGNAGKPADGQETKNKPPGTQGKDDADKENAASKPY